MYHRVKKNVHILMHPIQGETKWDKLLNGFLVTLILLNVVAVIVETDPVIYHSYKPYFDLFDRISVYIFSIEYILRVWSCTHEKKYRHWLWGRLKYMATPGAIIDLLAILPFYLQAFVHFDLRELRILRLFRFLRIFRLTSYMRSAQVVINVFRSKFQELLIALVLATALIVIAACIIYFAEHNAQPESFTSIPATLWWSVESLTTIGYGDMYPKTAIGKLLTSIILLIGVALFALPAGIITSGFLEEVRKVKRPKIHNCPHCGMPIDSPDDFQHVHD